MKRTLKCAIAAIGAAAIAVGTAVPASAVNFKTYITSNSGSCGNVGGADIDSLLKKYPSCLDFLKNYGIKLPTGGCTQKPGDNCPGGDCTQKPGDNDTVQKPGNNDTVQKPEIPDISVDSSVSAYEKKVVELVNEIRKEYGLSELKLNTKLCAVARAKSQDMKDNNYFSHTSPTYGSPFDMMKSFGISYRTAGENIAMGYRTPEEVVDGWMNSEGHRANILNGSFKEIGMGHVANGNYWTQMFIG
ncbi:MAG: serine protease [Oscillospiraceae bacterium]